jgi:hypothetical protein
MNDLKAESAVRGMAAECTGLQKALGAPVTDVAADWLAAQYAAKARQDLESADGATRWEILRAFVKDWHLLRRGDHAAARLQLAREKFDWLRANSQAEKEKEFWKWTEKPDVREKLYPNKENVITEETIRKIEKELRLL